MIRHTVVFKLRHAPGSSEEESFFKAAAQLATIAGVNKFEQLKQVSTKNDYAFGLSMEFENDAAYQGYNVHPLHVAFVKERWLTEVTAFMEIDYVPMG